MTSPLVCACGAPLAPGAGCQPCYTQLTVILHAIPELLRELDTTISRQVSSREGIGTGGRVDFDVAASHVRTELDQQLHHWARVLLHDHPVPKDRKAVADLLLLTTAGTAALLAGSPHLATAPWAGNLLLILRSTYDDGMAIIDRPSETEFIGWCPGTDRPCGTALYAPAGTVTARCPRCNATWPVAESRAQLLEQATHEVAPGHVLARALGIPLSTVRSWRRRGDLQQATTSDGQPLVDIYGHPLYSLAAARRLSLGQRPDTPRTKVIDLEH